MVSRAVWLQVLLIDVNMIGQPHPQKHIEHPATFVQQFAFHKAISNAFGCLGGWHSTVMSRKQLKKLSESRLHTLHRPSDPRGIACRTSSSTTGTGSTAGGTAVVEGAGSTAGAGSTSGTGGTTVEGTGIIGGEREGIV